MKGYGRYAAFAANRAHHPTEGESALCLLPRDQKAARGNLHPRLRRRVHVTGRGVLEYNTLQNKMHRHRRIQPQRDTAIRCEDCRSAGLH